MVEFNGNTARESSDNVAMLGSDVPHQLENIQEMESLMEIY